MTLFAEIVLGTVMLLACAVCQVLAVVVGAAVLRSLSRRLVDTRTLRSGMTLLLAGLMAMVAAHTLQIWGRAVALMILGAFPEFEASFYFATVTYTTLGYGDITLEEGIRVFVTFASISGLVTFGITSAFLVALIVRLLPSFGADENMGSVRDPRTLGL